MELTRINNKKFYWKNEKFDKNKKKTEQNMDSTKIQKKHQKQKLIFVFFNELNLKKLNNKILLTKNIYNNRYKQINN